MRPSVQVQDKRTLAWLVLALCGLWLTGCAGQPTAGPNQADAPRWDPPVADAERTITGDTPSALESLVMYEVNLRAFSPTADFPGATARLDELDALGVDVVWLMPIYPVGQEARKGGLGSPYSVADFVSVNPEFGTGDDLDAFVAGAHARDMKVILDWVANHTAWDHPWTRNDNWHTRNEAGEIVSPAGTDWDDVADLNYDEPELRVAMVEAMRFWVDRHDVDGYRADVADLVPVDFWTVAIDSAEDAAGHKLLMLAEGGNPELYDAGFDLTYGWDFYGALKAVYGSGEPATAIGEAHAREYETTPPGKHRLRYTTNHDETAWDDTPVALFGGERGAFGAFTLVATYGGVPLVYNGQEIGWPDRTAFFDRDPIDWAYRGPSLIRYHKLLATREEHPALQLGEREDFSNDDVAAFTRTADGQTVLVVVNTRDRESTVALPRSLHGRSAVDTFSEQPVTLPKTLRLKAYASHVIAVQ